MSKASSSSWARFPPDLSLSRRALLVVTTVVLGAVVLASAVAIASRAGDGDGSAGVSSDVSLPAIATPGSYIYRTEVFTPEGVLISVTQLDFEGLGNFSWVILENTDPRLVGYTRSVTSNSESGFPCTITDSGGPVGETVTTSCPGPEGPSIPLFLNPVTDARMIGALEGSGDFQTSLRSLGWEVADSSKSPGTVTLVFHGIYEGGLAYSDQQRAADPALDESLAPSKRYEATYDLDTSVLLKLEILQDDRLIQTTDLETR